MASVVFFLLSIPGRGRPTRATPDTDTPRVVSCRSEISGLFRVRKPSGEKLFAETPGAIRRNPPPYPPKPRGYPPKPYGASFDLRRTAALRFCASRFRFAVVSAAFRTTRSCSVKSGPNR